MHNINIPYFLKFYCLILAKLMVVMSIFFLIFNQYFFCTKQARFIESVNKLETLILSNSSALSPSDQWLQLLSDYYQLDIQKWSLSNGMCQGCDVVDNSFGLNIYQDDNKRLYAELNIDSSSQRWIVKQPVDAMAILYYFPLFIFIPIKSHIIFLFFVFFIILAVILYWPINKLQKTIDFLISICNEFADGNLQLRIENKIDQPLSDLAISLNAAANKVESTFYENKIFSQAIPHEMRTPLSRIQLAVDLIRQSPEKTELLDNIDTYIEDLNDLIVKVLMFSKLDNQYDNRSESQQSVDIKAFVESRLHIINQPQHIVASYQLKGVNYIKSDLCYLRLIIDNLLNNAFQYSNSKVSLQVINNNQFIEFNIMDDGPGIDEKNRDKVFLAFARLDDSRTRRTGGFGLGLAIAKASANRLGSKIIIEKNPTGGTVFKFKLSLNNL